MPALSELNRFRPALTSTGVLLASLCCAAAVLHLHPPALAAETQSTAQPPGQPVDFTIQSANAKPIRLSDYRGQWIVVNFWATWCPPCLDEIPDLVRFHRERASDGAMVLGVNFEELDPFLLESFLEDHDMSYPNGQVGDTPLVPFEPLKGLPTTFIVDPAGVIVVRRTGPIDFKWLNREFDEARNRHNRQ